MANQEEDMANHLDIIGRTEAMCDGLSPEQRSEAIAQARHDLDCNRRDGDELEYNAAQERLSALLSGAAE